MINIAIFASGAGTNAENIILNFSDSKYIKVTLVATNKEDAPVLKKAEKYSIPTFVFTNNELNTSTVVDEQLSRMDIDAIVLAGFLRKVPNRLIEKYNNKIINIHPALLPHYGGKGMYGDNVHKAVIEAGEAQSGITIHLIDSIYDNGKILFQKSVELDRDETPRSLAAKIHELEYQYFPLVIQEYLVSNQP